MAARTRGPEAYAILTIEANDDIAPYLDRQLAVLSRDQSRASLDEVFPEDEILRPLPARSFGQTPLGPGRPADASGLEG